MSTAKCRQTASRRPATEMYVRRGIVLCAHKTVCVCVSCNLYVHCRTGNPADRGPRIFANMCNIAPTNATCSKKRTHRHGRSNCLIRLPLSTGSVFGSRLSGAKSQPCCSCRSMVCLPCRTSCRTQHSSTASTQNLTTNRRRRWRTS